MSKINYVNADKLVITNRKASGNVYLSAGTGENLVIDGTLASASAGSNTQMIYNKNDVLSGSSRVTFDEQYLNSYETRSDKYIGLKTYYSPIHQGPSSYQITSTSYANSGTTFGTDVAISSNNKSAFLCPFNDGFSHNGGISMWSESAGVFSQYGSLLELAAFTFSESIHHTDINDDGTIIAFTDTTMTTYKYTGGSWSYLGGAIESVYKIKMSGNSTLTTLFYVDKTNKFYTRTSTSLGDWSAATLLVDKGGVTATDIPMSFYGGYQSFYFSGVIYVYLGGVLVQSIIASNVTSIDHSGAGFCYIADGYLIIRNSSFALEFSVNISAQHVCSNIDSVFTNSSGVLSCYKKISGIWTLQGTPFSTPTILGTGIKIACNNNYVIVGIPGSNKGAILKIQEYTNGQLFGDGLIQASDYYTNKISLENANGIVLKSSTVISEPLSITKTTQSTSTTTGALIVDGGVGIAKNVFCAGEMYDARSYIRVLADKNTNLPNTTSVDLTSSNYWKSVVDASRGQDITYSGGYFTFNKTGIYTYTAIIKMTNSIYIEGVEYYQPYGERNFYVKHNSGGTVTFPNMKYVPGSDQSRNIITSIDGSLYAQAGSFLYFGVWQSSGTNLILNYDQRDSWEPALVFIARVA